MSHYFADTNTLARRYLPATGTAWVQSWMSSRAGHVTVISQLAELEFAALLTRCEHEKNLKRDDLITILNQFTTHAAYQYLAVVMDAPLLSAARQLTLKHARLSASAAIHLASAQQAEQILGEKLLFISGNKNLLAAATAEGFMTDNPFNHSEQTLDA